MKIRHSFSILILFIFLIPIQAQNNKKNLQADSVFVYKDFKQCGTTAYLCYNHYELDSINAKQNKLGLEDLNDLNDILKFSKGKKLFQQKYGGEICYLIIFQNGIKKRFVAYISMDCCFLDDLDSMKRWKMKKQPERELFYKIVNKNWR